MEKEIFYVLGVRRNLGVQLDAFKEQLSNCFKSEPDEIDIDFTLDDIRCGISKYQKLIDSMLDLQIINNVDYANLQNDIAECVLKIQMMNDAFN